MIKIGDLDITEEFNQLEHDMKNLSSLSNDYKVSLIEDYLCILVLLGDPAEMVKWKECVIEIINSMEYVNTP